jgi:hypothetical protein
MLKFKIDLEFANTRDIKTNIDFLQKLYIIKLEEEKVEESAFDLLSIEPEFQNVSQIINGRNESEIQIMNDIKEQRGVEIIENTTPIVEDNKVCCACGVSYIRRNQNRHLKSKTHQIFESLKKI